MAKSPSFNFGANAKPKETPKAKGGKSSKGAKSISWAKYIGG